MSCYHSPFAHGIMFHHFKDELHPDGQGAITAEDFDNIISFVGRERILSSDEYMVRHLESKLDKDALCITFDDALRCQYDIAKPVLDAHGIKAFFFVYSSPLLGTVEPLEVYRYYRSTQFETVEDFYSQFFKSAFELEFKEVIEESLAKFNPKEYLSEFSFYTDEDRKFRYVRDLCLGPDNYFKIMEFMIEKSSLEKQELLDLLWMKEDNIVELSQQGHTIGLHSFTHPTKMNALSYKDQEGEFLKNKQHLERVLNKSVKTMSHPCNSYNQNTLSILNDMDIQIGFRANMEPGFKSNYEIPREDHIIVHNQTKGLL